MKQWCIVTVCILLSAVAFAQSPVNITPAYPQRGDSVVITYDPSAPGAAIPADVKGITLVFTYSTLYEQPWRIELQQKQGKWTTGFRLPRYAVLATFYLKAGEYIQQPAPHRHYAIEVYNRQQQLIKNSYLYKAYSLSAQMGHADSLGLKQEALYREELAHYPDNYEAKLRLLNYQVQHSSHDAAAQYRKQAQALIAAKFRENPTQMDNLNQVTMGYLIIGENSRLDSIRAVVMKDYPHADVAKELVLSVIGREKDTTRRIALLEKELADEKPGHIEAYKGIHEQLFTLYAYQKDSAKALYHARMMLLDSTPYTPKMRQQVASTLAANQLALDTALAYAQKALSMAGEFPVGIIRHFPQYGYIPSYATDSARHSVQQKATGNLLALMGLIYAGKEDATRAKEAAHSALQASQDAQTLQTVAQVYESLQEPAQAFSTYRMILVQEPTDSTVWQALEQSYTSWKGSGAGFDTVQQAVMESWKEAMRQVLEREKLHQQAPVLTGFLDMNGQPVTPEMVNNKVVIVDFWATWCVPCMREMPYLNRVYEQYKNNPAVVFLVTNSGARNTLEDAQGWDKRKPYGFPVYFANDPEVGSKEKFDFNVIPALFVIDTHQQLQFKSIGFEGPIVAPKLALEIEMLLDNR